VDELFLKGFVFGFYVDKDFTAAGSFLHAKAATCHVSCGTDKCTSVSTACLRSYEFDEYSAGDKCDVATCANRGCVRSGTCRTCSGAANEFCHLCADIECDVCTGYTAVTCTTCNATRTGVNAGACDCKSGDLYSRASITDICK
jgi:hypothetical protein